jgi:hypothetical protein
MQLMDKLRCDQSKLRGVPVLPIRKRQSINSRLIPNGSMVDFSMRHTFLISITLRITCFEAAAQLTKSMSPF